MPLSELKSRLMRATLADAIHGEGRLAAGWPWPRLRGRFRAVAAAVPAMGRAGVVAVAQRIPARRIGTDEDMQGVAIFLASRDGDYAVGITIAVDGGIAFGSRVTAVCGTRCSTW